MFGGMGGQWMQQTQAPYCNIHGQFNCGCMIQNALAQYTAGIPLTYTEVYKKEKSKKKLLLLLKGK